MNPEKLEKPTVLESPADDDNDEDFEETEEERGVYLWC